MNPTHITIHRLNSQEFVSSAMIEAYINNYLKKKHNDKFWVRDAFSLDSSKSAAKKGMEVCGTVYRYVAKLLSHDKNFKNIDAYIDKVVLAVEERCG